MTEAQSKWKRDRRTLLQGALATAALAAVPRAMRAMPNAISPSAALQRLMDGNARYMRNQIDLKDFTAGRAARAQAQYPIAAVLGGSPQRLRGIPRPAASADAAGRGIPRSR